MIDNIHQLLGKHSTGKSCQLNWQQHRKTFSAPDSPNSIIFWFTDNNSSLSSWCLWCELDDNAFRRIHRLIAWLCSDSAGYSGYGRCLSIWITTKFFGTKAVKDSHQCEQWFIELSVVFLQLHRSYHSLGYIRWRQRRASLLPQQKNAYLCCGDFADIHLIMYCSVKETENNNIPYITSITTVHCSTHNKYI